MPVASSPHCDGLCAAFISYDAKYGSHQSLREHAKQYVNGVFFSVPA